jgi:hypothetical protein
MNGYSSTGKKPKKVAAGSKDKYTSTGGTGGSPRRRRLVEFGQKRDAKGVMRGYQKFTYAKRKKRFKVQPGGTGTTYVVGTAVASKVRIRPSNTGRIVLTRKPSKPSFTRTTRYNKPRPRKSTSEYSGN